MCNCPICRCNKQCENSNTEPEQKPGELTPELYKYWYEGGTLEQLHVASTNGWNKISPNFLLISKGFIYRKAQTPHVHAEVIKAWADGGTVQYKCKEAWITTKTQDGIQQQRTESNQTKRTVDVHLPIQLQHQPTRNTSR